MIKPQLQLYSTIFIVIWEKNTNTDSELHLERYSIATTKKRYRRCLLVPVWHRRSIVFCPSVTFFIFFSFPDERKPKCFHASDWKLTGASLRSFSLLLAGRYRRAERWGRWADGSCSSHVFSIARDKWDHQRPSGLSPPITRCNLGGRTNAEKAKFADLKNKYSKITGWSYLVFQ